MKALLWNSILEISETVFTVIPNYELPVVANSGQVHG